MFTSKTLTFFYAVTPVHMGAGQALGVIDNPIQRERHTEHPCFAGSGIKGAFRHAARTSFGDAGLVDRIFGPETSASDYAGAISFADAQLVAFPVRSLKGVYVYVTSPLALRRLARLAQVAGVEFPALNLPALGDDHAVVLHEGLLVKGNGESSLVLESYAYKPRNEAKETLKKASDWISKNALPDTEAHGFFRKKLAEDLVLLSDNQFTFFARHATVVEPHVRINDETGTADDGGLFFTENLPPETVMVSLTMASQERRKLEEDKSDRLLDAEGVMKEVVQTFDGKCLQIGGDASTGRGQVVVKFLGGAV
jgi:CRISPR-associated protein Cmr4